MVPCAFSCEEPFCALWRCTYAHVWLAQANSLHFCGRAQLTAPQKGAEVASAALEGQRLTLAWSDGTLQSLRISTAPDAQVSHWSTKACRASAIFIMGEY